MKPTRVEQFRPGRVAAMAASACAPILYLIACGDGAVSTHTSQQLTTSTTGSATSASSSSGSSSVAASTGGASSSSAVGVGVGGGGGGGGAGGASVSTGGVGGGADASDASDEDGPVVCSTDTFSFRLAPGIHLPICTPIVYPTNPPTSGPHYPIWAAYKTYAIPIPRGFYVHDLEHGGIVITYNCAGNCDADLATLQAYIDARPADPECMPAPPTARITVTPDPLLDVKFAASAWGFALKSNCFDLVGLDSFITAHYGMGPEDFCSDGIDLSQPGAFPPGCGDILDGGADDSGDAGD